MQISSLVTQDWKPCVLVISFEPSASIPKILLENGVFWDPTLQ